MVKTFFFFSKINSFKATFTLNFLKFLVKVHFLFFGDRFCKNPIDRFAIQDHKLHVTSGRLYTADLHYNYLIITKINKFAVVSFSNLLKYPEKRNKSLLSLHK